MWRSRWRKGVSRPNPGDCRLYCSPGPGYACGSAYRRNRCRWFRSHLECLNSNGMEVIDVLTLYSYPQLFGVADNNPFGLKVYAFLKLSDLPFRHEHIFDASKAPRGQLPYLVDGDTVIGDSDAIISHLISRNAITIDNALTPTQ